MTAKANTQISYASVYAEALCPPPVMAMDTWADDRRRLPAVASPEPGKWRTDRVPFMREIMQALSAESVVEDVSLKKGTQISGTELGLNLIFYTVDHDPASIMVVVPTLKLAQKFSNIRLQPAIEIMPSLLEKFADRKSRDSGNTILEKSFDGGVLLLVGSESSSDLKSVPICILIMDEVDEYPLNLAGQGDTEALAIKRTQNYKSRRKIYRNSTPTLEGSSRIDRSFIKGDQRYYYLKCPHCGERQHLVWKNIRWNKDLPAAQQPASAYYACKHNGCSIEEHHKTKMLAEGKWIPHNPSAPESRRSYHINSLYSPLGWYSWAEAVQDWLDAQGDVEKLITFTNTVLAECWKDSVNDVSAAMLQGKAESYARGVVPRGALKLLGSVDIQKDRIEAFVYGVGRGEEQWFVDYEVFYGDPGIPCKKQKTDPDSPWDELDDWLQKPWQHELGAVMKVESYAVDTGYLAHDVYNYVRSHQREKAVAIKGAKQHDAPLIGRPKKMDINILGRVIKNGVDLYSVGTQGAKTTVYNRYQREETSGPGTIHFPDWLPFEIFEQLTAERLHRKYVNGYAVYAWAKVSSASRNEATDCIVYIQALIQKIGLHRYSKARWDTIEQGLMVTDLFSQPALPEAEPVALPADPPRAKIKKTKNSFTEVKPKW